MITIIGGGVAGLAAANRLADRGEKAILIEGGHYPAHKVCGEFISPEALPQLDAWELSPTQKIDRIAFAHRDQRLEFRLPTPAGSERRFRLDAKLAQRAQEAGVEVRTGTRVEKIEPGYRLTLSSGEILDSKQVIIGTGRLTSAPPKFPYIGIKAHFEGISPSPLLEMQMVPGGYAGLSSVGDGITNLTCLAHASAVQRAGSARRYMERHVLPPLHARLEGGVQLFRWMEVKAPAFGIRRPPHWENAHFIGDAAGVIAPACGDGLAMGITSGVMAADYALEGKWAEFRAAYLQRYRRRLRLGNLVHRLLLRPRFARLVYAFPRAIDQLFTLTRDPLSR